MTNMSLSFLGLIKITSSDSSEGWTYSVRTFYPFKLAIENNWGTCQKWWGKIGNSISRVSSSLLNMTLSALCWVGISSFSSLIFLGWVVHFFPSIWSLPHRHAHRSYGSKSCQTPESCRRYVQELVPLQLHLLLILCTIWNHFRSFVSYWWCGIHHGPPLTWSLPVDFSLLSSKLTERLPSSTLELACPNGKFFALDDKFTSLDFDQVIPGVFDISSFIHILWTMFPVPWEPLSLLVVYLALVNGSHHWLVIKWLLSMFDFNTFIRMLEFVLWSGRLECKTLG